MSSSSPESFTAWAPPSLEDPDRRAAGSPVARAASAPAVEAPPKVEYAPSAWRAPLLDQGEAQGEQERSLAQALRDEHRKGYAEGEIAGRDTSVAELRTALEAVVAAARGLEASRSQTLGDLEANVTALALAVARRIVQREVQTDPAVVRDLVVRGLELIKPDAPVEMRLHPDDLELLRPELDSLGGDDDRVIRWGADVSLERGEFFAEGPRRIVDGRLDEALRIIYERLSYE